MRVMPTDVYFAQLGLDCDQRNKEQKSCQPRSPKIVMYCIKPKSNN